MIKQCVCSLCGKIFNYDEYGYDYDSECFKHEVLEHLKGDKYCKGIIKDAINELNQKYKVNFTINNYNFNPYYSDYGRGENQIDLSFALNTTNENITIRLEIDCKNQSINLTKEKMIEELNSYYIENTEKKYIGVVEFEDWCGGDGMDDFVINGIYMRDIMRRLKGKKIRIEVL